MSDEVKIRVERFFVVVNKRNGCVFCAEGENIHQFEGTEAAIMAALVKEIIGQKGLLDFYLASEMPKEDERGTKQ